jgi:hypothetical protein
MKAGNPSCVMNRPQQRMLDYRILVAATLERDTAARELCGAMGTAA